MSNVSEQRQALLATAQALAATVVAIRRSRAWALAQALRRMAGRPPAPLTPPRTDMTGTPQEDVMLLQLEIARVQRELAEVNRSRVRRTAFALRRLADVLPSVAAHPLWWIAAGWRRMTSRGVLGALRSGWTRYARERRPLRHAPADAMTVTAPAPEAVRWLGPVTLSGRTGQALFCHPVASASYDLDLPRAGWVDTAAALAPLAWPHNRTGVVCTLTVQSRDGHWRASTTRLVNPGARFVDRRWRPMRLAVPAHACGPITVTLATALPPGGDGGHAWAIWSDPALVCPSTAEARRRTRRGIRQRLRQHGWRGVWGQIKALPAAGDHAMRYRQWVAGRTPGPADLEALGARASALPGPPRFSIVVPVYNTDPRWLKACLDSVVAQVYPHWELCVADDASPRQDTQDALQAYRGDARIKLTRLDRNGGIAAASAAALAMATGDWIVLLDHDDVLPPEALAEVALALAADPAIDAVFSDEDKLDAYGDRCDPYFKPDWAPEHFLSTNYLCHLSVFRASVVRDAGGFRPGYDGAQDYDLWLRVSERTTRIHHIPKILYHWRMLPESTASAQSAKSWATEAGERALADHLARTGVDAVVVPGASAGLYRVRRRLASRPLVSIVIPTDGRVRDVDGVQKDLLLGCLTSVVEKSTYENYELVIMDNGAISPAAEAFLRGLTRVPHTRVRFEGEFNYSRKMNFGVSHSRGEQLVLFNDDLEIITSEWIEALLEYSQLDAIGAVGPKLVYPDGRLQHIGVVMGVCGMAAHAFHSHPGSSGGYFSSALVPRNYSALTAACLMTRRELYTRMGGFDDCFRFDFNDTDYCLRLRAAGYRLVFTPHAQLYHLEGATFGGRGWDAGDLQIMQARWGDVCANDPYYNPNLTRDLPDYSLRA
jgi:GT2 family glycosyltransferase